MRLAGILSLDTLVVSRATGFPFAAGEDEDAGPDRLTKQFEVQSAAGAAGEELDVPVACWAGAAPAPHKAS